MINRQIYTLMKYRRGLFRLAWIAVFITCGFPSLAFETPGPMIKIEANIYEYRLDHERQLGLFYEYTRKSGSFRDSQIYLPGTENQRDNPIPALDIVTTLAKGDFGRIEMNLKAAVEEGRATVISNPIGMVVDGQKTLIQSGEEVPLTVLQLQGYQTMLKTETRPTGIKLAVTPRIYSGNVILLDLEVESSEITRFDIFDRGDKQRYELPVVSKRNIKSVVLIPSAQQLYIGGLYTNTTGDLVRKVPIAGDIPILGVFLRGTNKQKRQSETVFQLTPTITYPGTGVSTEDTIFKDLLRSDEKMDIINEPKILEEAEMSSPFEPIIPGPDAGQIEDSSNINAAGSTVAPATDTLSVQPVSEQPATPNSQPKESRKKSRRSNRPGHRDR